MGLTICNGYSSEVTVAIGYPNSNQCANAGGWIKQGWWNIAPGQCAYVYGGSLKDVNRYWAYYAHAANGTVWSGNNYCTQVTNQSFYQCWNDPSQYQICYRLLDINSNDNHTLTLTA
jgi:uncharacterized membrane protein